MGRDWWLRAVFRMGPVRLDDIANNNSRGHDANATD